MRHPFLCAFGILLLALVAPAGLTQTSPGQKELERIFDASISPAEMSGWMKTMAAEPNHVGSPHNRLNAERTLAYFRSWGWNAKIEEFRVLYPTPLKVSLELMSPKRYTANLSERPVPGDATSSRVKGVLPAYVAFQGDGDVTAPLVYVNYGMPDDYRTLERMGVDVGGKIVIARYGQGWRGLKPKLAQDHGAVGCIIYSDPHDDGFATDDAYPRGPSRPAQGIQRGSVADMTLYPGDPLTPGYGSIEGAPRQTRNDAPTLLRIPVLPVSYGDARVFLGALEGNVAPPAWRGSLPQTYHVGGTQAARARLIVKSDWSLRTIYNVVARMEGAKYPDQWVLRGNHHDAWVFGASDPVSGHVAMMAEAKAIGEMAKTGWRPKRTLIYLSWDAEEPMLLGSTEWVETHAAELKDKALVYINTDGNARGFLSVDGNHAFQNFVAGVAADVTDPQTGVSVDRRRRAQAMLAASAPSASERVKAVGKAALESRDLPLDPLGSGSDYSGFVQHIGIASLNVGYGGEGESGGVYHSAYDTWEHHSRFVDPGFAYAGALAKTTGRMVIRMSESDIPVQRYTDFADTVGVYLDELKTLVTTKRDAQLQQARLFAVDAYRLADDPTRTSGSPSLLRPVPYFNFAPLENSLLRLRASAAAYDRTLAVKNSSLSDDQKSRLIVLAARTEQAMTMEPGLPGGRSWYKNMVYAPGRLTGYGAKTLPGVREAIEEERWDEASDYIELTARALTNYAALLDQGIELMGGAPAPGERQKEAAQR